MSKKIFSIGYQIPGDHAEHVDLSSEQSLMDADILLISPDSLKPSGGWVSFSSGGGCYDVGSSRIHTQRIFQLKKEIIDHLNFGKNVFILLSKKEEYTLSNSMTVSKNTRNYNTATLSNYHFLPVNIGTLTSASGKHIEFSGNQIFSNFYKKFEKYLEYQLYIENPSNAQVIFAGKNKTKILGAVYKVGTGNLIVLPYLSYDYDKFVKTKKNKKGEEEEFWTETALKFGHGLVECLVQIASDLNKSTDKTLPPEWTRKHEFICAKEEQIIHSIKKEEQKIIDIGKEIEKLNVELSEEKVLKDLLFEQGKLLENAVTKSLKILGYSVENYDDGELEMDQVIISPEGHRYISECEGKNEKDIDISKLRQLIESMNADFNREEVEEKAFGILFGNPQRLTIPVERTLDFTKKCKTGAEREKIALIKTADLFKVVKYLSENRDEQFKNKCREAIHNGLGTIVLFPDLPI